MGFRTCHVIVLFCIFFLVSPKCPPGQYYEPRKGCRSCHFICQSASTQDQCRFLCSDPSSIEKIEIIEDKAEASTTQFHVSPAIVITLICAIVLIGTSIGGFLFYKYRWVNRMVDYNVAATRPRQLDLELQLINNHQDEWGDDELGETWTEGDALWQPIQCQGHDGDGTPTPSQTPRRSISTQGTDDNSRTETVPAILQLPNERESVTSLPVSDDIPEDETAKEDIPSNTSTISTEVTDLRTQDTNLHTHDPTESQNIYQTSQQPPKRKNIQHAFPESSGAEVEVVYCRQCAVRQLYCRHQSTSTSSLANRLNVTDNSSAANHPAEPGETLLKSPIPEASPDGDQFSVDEATEFGQYSQEATTEENSQLALNSAQSLPPPPFMALLHAHCSHCNVQVTNNSTDNVLVNPSDLGVTLVDQAPVVIPSNESNTEGNEETDDSTSDSGASSEPEDVETQE